MKIIITRKAEKSLDKIPDPIAKNIAKEILKLSKNPYPANSQKLSGQGNYRLRVGVHRVIYSFEKKSKEITILRVAHRKEVYR